MKAEKIQIYKKHIQSLVLLSLPIIIGQLGNIVTGLADTVMVGQHSTDELAAASFVNNVINAFIILGTGFSYNYIPIIGENFAVNRHVAIGGWLKNSLMANWTTTIIIVICLLLILFNLPVLRQPDELIPLIKPYYVVLLFSVPFVMLANSFRQFVEGIMDASISMWVLTLGNILNIVGNYALIYGKLGLPELGLFGAGVSTLISRVFMLLLFVAIFIRRNCYLSYRKGFFAVGVNKKDWKRLNKLGWPIAMQQGIEAATFCITTIMIGWLGGLELAAHQIAIAVSTVSFTIYLGLGSAVAIRVSMYNGLKDVVNVRRTTLSGVILAAFMSVVISVVLLLFHDAIGALFSDDAMVVGVVATLIPILVAYQFGDSTQIILANALRGLSDVNAIMLISFVTYFIIALPAGYCIAFIWDMGIRGVWMSYPIGLTCSAVLLSIRACRKMNS
ncbi:MAG: MATE family efflux transporter [Bacteroides sp.]|nr:MATE family efflux transporter [Bacteroides sp.]